MGKEDKMYLGKTSKQERKKGDKEKKEAWYEGTRGERKENKTNR